MEGRATRGQSIKSYYFSPMNRIHKLDGLRGLFALFVVLFHFNINNAPAFLVNNFFVRESYIFVDFFFILSGYVIALTYDDKINSRKTFMQFLLKRCIRLYPLLLFSTGMYWYFVHPHFDKQNIFLALDTLLLTNSTPILGTGIGMNYPSWSISSEMISYLVFGVCSLVAFQKRKIKLISIITIICLGFLAYQQNYFQTGSFGFIRGLACFNLGFIVYVLAKKKIQLPNSIEWMIATGILVLMYCHFTATFQNALWIQFMIPISFAISIFIMIKTNGFLSKLLQTKPFLFLGKISYSVYLNQAFIIGYCIPKLFRWIQCTNGETKKTISIVFLLVILVLYSWATQYLVEKQIGKKLMRLIRN